MPNPLNDRIRQTMSSAKRIVIVSHIRPDGDAIGSLLGMGLGLQVEGKHVQMVLADGVPSVFRHLPGADQVQKKIEGEYDLSVVLDCSDLFRTGGILGERKPDINIDHHITNQHFAEINFVEPDAVATSAVLAQNFKEWGLSINRNIAKVLLSGLVSDTIGFRTPNVTPNTLRLAADLMEHDINLSDIYTRALMRRSIEAARYWGLGLSGLQQKDRIVWSVLSLGDRARVGYPGNDDADLNNVLSNLDGVDVSVLIIEQRPGHSKVSWRAQPGFDVSAVALSFGGGGHPAAAGVEMDGTLEEITQKVLKATQSMLDNNRDGKKKNLKKEGKIASGGGSNDR